MPIRVRCTPCQKSLRVPDQEAGIIRNCPGCGGMLKVPTVEEAKATGAYVEATAVPAKPPAAPAKPAAPAVKAEAKPSAPNAPKPAAAAPKPVASAPKPVQEAKPTPAKAPAAESKPAAAPAKSPSAKPAPAAETPPKAPAKPPAPAFKAAETKPAAKASPTPAPPSKPSKTPAASASDDPFGDLGDPVGLNVDLSSLEDLSPAGPGGLDSLLDDGTGSSGDLVKPHLGAAELPEISADDIDTTPAITSMPETTPAKVSSSKSSAKLVDPAKPSAPSKPAEKAADKPVEKPAPARPTRPAGAKRGLPEAAIDVALALTALAASAGVYFAVAPPPYMRPAIAVVRGSGQGGAATIRIEGDNKVLVSGRPVASPEAIAAELQSGAVRQLVIEVSGDALYDTVERVIAAAGRGGVTQVQLATTEP